MAKIAQLKEDYAGEWLAIALPQEGDGTTAEEGDLVFHSKNRDEVWKRTKADTRKIYVTYAGPPLPPGWAAAF